MRYTTIQIFSILLLIILIFSVALNFPRKDIKNTSFIQSNGKKLILNNSPLAITGINDYDLAYKDSSVIDQTFQTLHATGINTIRFWLFGDGLPNGFQPNLGIYNEQRFRQVDYILSEAQKYHMYVIPTLVNNWTDYGGKGQYARWVNENPNDDNIFYTDSQIKTSFENYIMYILSRRNTVTNITYDKDPSILGWDIMNEPRGRDQYTMNNFLISIASFIKKYDVNHLVFAGTELSANVNPTPADIGKSSNVCVSTVIDICSVHLYLFNNNQPLYTTISDVTTFLNSQNDYAMEVNKPLLIEEFGIARNTKPFGQNQLPIMKQLISNFKTNGSSGFLIWDWSNTPDSPFTFSPVATLNTYSLFDLQTLLK